MMKIDDKLVDVCQNIEILSNDVNRWVDTNEGVLAAETGAIHDMTRRLRQRTTSLRVAVASRPAVGVVGPGGSGKTHLIAGLAGRNVTPLGSVFDGFTDGIDYIRDIGCVVDNRAAVVTRFTTQNEGTPTKFPVAVHLLSKVDIVRILASCFLSGSAIGDVEIPAASDIEDMATRLGRHMSHTVQPGFNNDELWSIRMHLEASHGGARSVWALAANGYWDYFTAMMPRLSQAGQIAMLSLLWGRAPLFTRIYEETTQALNKLGDEQQAYCAMSALCVVDPTGRHVSPRPDSIIGVGPLLRFGMTDDETVLVRSKHGAWAAIKRSVLAILIGEVRIHLEENDSTLLEQVDLLEFPCQQQSSQPFIPASAHGPEPVAESAPLRTGTCTDTERQRLDSLYLFAGYKAAHLFDDYSARREITCLVVCSDADQPELSNLSRSVTAWVNDSHGFSAAARETLGTGLFLVLTKLDKVILSSTGAGEPAADWDTHLDTALANGIARGSDWSGHWTPERPFDNVFVLRSPHHQSLELCDYLSNGLELCIKSSRANDVAGSKDHFLRSNAIQRHVADPQSMWAEAVEPGDGGISYLTQSILQMCNEPEKYRQIATELTKLRAELGQRLQRFYVSDDLFAHYDARRRSAQNVLRSMQHCASERELGRLIRLLHVDEGEIVSLFHTLDTNPYRENSNYAPPAELSTDGAMKTLSDSLQEMNFSDAPAALPRAQDAAEDDNWDHQADDRARRYARVAMSYWAERLRKLPVNNGVAGSVEMKTESFASLIDELLSAANRHDLEERIAREIDAGLTKHTNITASTTMAAIIAAEVFGKFINCLGYDEEWAEHHPRRKGRAQSIIFPPRQKTTLASVHESRSSLGNSFQSDWSVAYMAMVDDNAEYLRRTRYDLDEDRQLGQLLGALLPSEVWPVFRSSL